MRHDPSLTMGREDNHLGGQSYRLSCKGRHQPKRGTHQGLSTPSEPGREQRNSARLGEVW